MRNYLNHPVTKPTCKKHIGGYLSKEISMPQWFTDPTHRAKCVSGEFFELVKIFKSLKKLEALRLKNYCSYYIKMNRKKSIEDIRKNIMESLDHIFDDHNLCDNN